MKRDLDLIRNILLKLEGIETPREWLDPDKFEGYGDEIVSYHFEILSEAGLIKAENNTTIGVPIKFNSRAMRLTWAGHDFLDAMRDDTRWKKVKDFVKKYGGMISIELTKKVAVEALKTQLQQGGILP
jgi:hypothetical protein